MLLQKCLEGHADCCERQLQQSARRKLPTRLVDLTQCCTAGLISVTKTRNLDLRTPYMTLSHRWGSESGYQLDVSAFHYHWTCPG